MPDPTPLSPLAGIELRHDDECPLRGYIAIETDDCGCEAQRKASYLAGLGKVLAECARTYRQWDVASVMAGCSPRDDAACGAAHDEFRRAAERLGEFLTSTYLTSPRETGKEKE